MSDDELHRTTEVDRAELARLVSREHSGRDVIVPVALLQRVLNDLHARRAELDGDGA